MKVEKGRIGILVVLLLCPFVVLARATATDAPTPMPAAKGTATPSLKRSGVLPFGNVAPPSGEHWQLTFDDEFRHDTAINPNLWNTQGSGGMPMCHQSGPIECGYVFGEDCLGYAGGVINTPSECDPNPTGTLADGNSWYDLIGSGALQMMPGLSTLVSDNYGEAAWAGVQNFGHFSQTYGYFEWFAQLPDTTNGRADGYHSDLWCTSNLRQTVIPFGANCPACVEFDVNEWTGSPANANSTSFGLWDWQGGPDSVLLSYFNYGVSSGNLHSTYHRYAVNWKNTGVGFGTLQLYVDGTPVGAESPPLSGSAWGSGVYCFAGWIEEMFGQSFNGGLPLDSNTSTNNPLNVRYFRAWQAQ